jgi:TolB-like protein/Flp pilus assembly protein TadD
LSFLREIKRRHVFRVAAVYAVVAWLVVQVVDVVNDPLGLPGPFDTVVIVLLGIGFPIALVLAWAFDLTPDGIVRTGTVGSTTDTVPPSVTSRASAPSTEHVPPSPATKWTGSRPEILRNSVAVLPLENLSPNPNDAYFAAGIHEEILNQLSKIKDLSVIARTSVKRYRDTDKSIAEIAAELGVGTIMEGSVRYAGERVRVTAQLIDAATENHLWSEIYERDLADVFAIQADVAEKIATALEAEFSVAEKTSVAKPPTDSPEAYALYLRALAILQEYGTGVGGSPEMRSSSQSYLDQAIALDPEFASAYVERARLSAYRLHQDPGVHQDGATPRAELEALALRDVHKALALDPDIGAAHGILARTHQYNWRGSEARAAYLRALELAPNDPNLRMDFAVFCAMTGRSGEAIAHAKQAIRLDPNSEGHVFLVFVHLFNHDQHAAIEAARRAVGLSPVNGMAHILLGAMESNRGNYEKALEETRLGEHLVRDVTNPVFLGHVAYDYSLLGLRGEVERIVRRLEEMAVTRRIPSAAWIFAYHALGDEEQTLHWLNAAGEDPESYVGHFGLMFFKLNALADPRLDEPRFRAVRERLGFRDQGVSNPP